MELNKLTLKYKALFVIDGLPLSLSKNPVPDKLTFRPEVDWQKLIGKYSQFDEDILCIFNGATKSQQASHSEAKHLDSQNGKDPASEDNEVNNDGSNLEAMEDKKDTESENLLFMDSSANFLDTQKIWLLIGAFSQVKKVRIFTDAPEDYNACLGFPQPESLSIHSCSEAATFDV